MAFAEGVPTEAITLGGKVYRIAFTWGARRRCKEYFDSRGKDPAGSHQYEAVAAAIWAGMEEEDRKGISVEAVEDMIHPGNEAEILRRVGDLTEKSQPDPVEVKTEPGAVKEPTPGAMNSNERGHSGSLISA